MFRKKNLRAAAESTHTAADRRDAADRAVQAISDYVETFSPYLTQAGERVQPLVHQAQDRITPLVQQAQERVEPYAKQARKAGASKAHDALDALTPLLNDALDKVTPAVDAARDKVQSDLLPRLQDALEAAQENEVVQEGTRRGKATVAALKGEIEAPHKKKGGFFKVVGTIALALGLGGAAFVAVRKFLGGGQGADTWNSYDTTSSFAKAPNTSTTPAPVQDPVTDEADLPAETFDRIDPADDATGEGMVGDLNEVAADPDLDAQADELGADGSGTDGAGTEPGAPVNSYGANAYVGAEPPEGYTIKGNERSMKYHTADSGGYDRTIADVWFDSEEAAQAAGFSKAQR